jgi:hypothetical protein
MTFVIPISRQRLQSAILRVQAALITFVPYDMNDKALKWKGRISCKGTKVENFCPVLVHLTSLNWTKKENPGYFRFFLELARNNL